MNTNHDCDCNGNGNGNGDPRLCENTEVRQVVSLAPPLFAESIAISGSGNLAVSIPERPGSPQASVREFDACGDLVREVLFPVGTTVRGLALGPNCELNAVVRGPNAGVQRILPDGTIEQDVRITAPGTALNDLVFDRRGNLFVTDSLGGRVFRIDACDGEVTTNLQDARLAPTPVPPTIPGVGANGIAIDPFGRYLYVNNLSQGLILRMPLSDGPVDPDCIEVIAQDPRLVGADAMTFDEAGNLYIANNTTDTILRLDVLGNLHEVACGLALGGPAGLAFGLSGSDVNTLFIASFDRLRLQNGGVVAIHVPRRGAALTYTPNGCCSACGCKNCDCNGNGRGH